MYWRCLCHGLNFYDEGVFKEYRELNCHHCRMEIKHEHFGYLDWFQLRNGQEPALIRHYRKMAA